MKTANQILASNPSKAQLTRAIDARMDRVAKLLEDARWLVDEAATLMVDAEFDNYEMRNTLMPLIVKAQSVAKKA